MAASFDQVFLAKLKEIEDRFLEYIADGSAKDYTDYKRVCGFIEGISTAEREFKELFSRIDEE
ncbi:MAG: hypothetical protein HRU16_03855 [Planctomycetes bacterium]|nr:hypothetical protein [Planctomycetota bacterium]